MSTSKLTERSQPVDHRTNTGHPHSAISIWMECDVTRQSLMARAVIRHLRLRMMNVNSHGCRVRVGGARGVGTRGEKRQSARLNPFSRVLCSLIWRVRMSQKLNRARYIIKRARYQQRRAIHVDHGAIYSRRRENFFFPASPVRTARCRPAL